MMMIMIMMMMTMMLLTVTIGFLMTKQAEPKSDSCGCS